MLHTMKIALLLLIAVVGLLQNQTTINWKNYSQMALGSMKNFPCFLCFMIWNMSNFKLLGAGKNKWQVDKNENTNEADWQNIQNLSYSFDRHNLGWNLN